MRQCFRRNYSVAALQKVFLIASRLLWCGTLFHLLNPNWINGGGEMVKKWSLCDHVQSVPESDGQCLVTSVQGLVPRDQCPMSCDWGLVTRVQWMIWVQCPDQWPGSKWWPGYTGLVCRGHMLAQGCRPSFPVVSKHLDNCVKHACLLGLGVGLHTCDTRVLNDLEVVQVCVDGGLSHVLLSVQCSCATIYMFIVNFNMLLCFRVWAPSENGLAQQLKTPRARWEGEWWSVMMH